MQSSKRTLIKGLGLAVTLSAALGGAAIAQAEENRSYILATASTGGTYYPVGVELATRTKVKLEPQYTV